MILFKRFKDYPYSLLLVISFILSFTLLWIMFLIIFYVKLENNYFLLFLSYIIFFITIIYFFRNKTTTINNSINISRVFKITFILSIPLLLYVGEIFHDWDALASWNRWALELYSNTYQPYNTAYPILLPSIWSIFYKIQGTSDIWWTVKLMNFYIPIMLIAILLCIYYETKNRTFLLIIIFSYPALMLTSKSTNGYMDIPVMIVGLLSIVLLYLYEISKYKKRIYYIYCALLLAGISCIIKQAGLIFLIFCYIYIALNFKSFNKKDRLMTIFISILSLFYTITYLVIFFNYQNNVIGNLDYLKEFANEQVVDINGILALIIYYFKKFFGLVKIYLFLSPFLMGLFIILVLKKDLIKLRKYNSINFLSLIFFIISTVIWFNYFSYDNRNSMFILSFFILFLSINLRYKLYIVKGIKLFFIKYRKIFFILLTATIILFLILKADKYIYKHQIKMQSKLSNIDLALKIKDLLTNKIDCVKIYTNINYLGLLNKNYHLKNFKNRILYKNKNELFNLRSSCKDGLYIIFDKFYNEITNIKNIKSISFSSDSNKIFFLPYNVKN